MNSFLKKSLFITLALAIITTGIVFVIAGGDDGDTGVNCTQDPGSCVDYGLVGFWDFEEGTGATVNDRSGNSNNGTLTYMATGTPWTTGIVPFSGGRPGGTALDFDGVDDYVQVADDDSLDPGTSDITISAWVKTSAANAQTIVDKYDNLGGWLFRVDSAGNLRFLAYDGGTTINEYTLSFSLDDGNWHHVAVSVDRSAEIANFYVDGVVEQEPFTNIGSLVDTATLYIGYRKKTGEEAYFDGSIDEVRIYNRALSSEEIRYHYNRGGPVAHWSFNEGSGKTAHDATANDNDGSLYGEMATSTAQNSGWTTGKHGSALAFDGSDDYVEVPDSTSLEPNYFTISAWIYSQTAGADVNQQTIVSKGDNPWSYYLTVGAQKVNLWHQGPGTWLTGRSTVPLNQWIHVAGTWDGITRKVWLNGVEDGLISDTAATSYGAHVLRIGWRSDGAHNKFNGLIDDVKIYNYARSPAQIQEDYNAGLAAHFGPKTNCAEDPGSCITEGLVGYWDFEEGEGIIVNDQSGNSNNGTSTNGPKWATASDLPSDAFVSGKGAMDFDGTDDYVDMGDVLDFGQSDDFTISAWVKTTNTNGYVVQKINSAASIYYYFGVFSSKLRVKLKDVNANNPEMNSTNIVNDGKWHHVVSVRDAGNNLYLYIDGMSDRAPVVDTTNSTLANDGAFEIGQRSNGGAGKVPFDGLVDDVRIYNRALSVEEVRYLYNRTSPTKTEPIFAWDDDSSLVGHWSFDDGSGTVAQDKSGNENNGILTSGPKWAPGKLGPAMDFDGINDYVNVDYKSILDFKGANQSFTISAWIKTDSLSSDTGIVGRWWDVSNSQYVLKIESDTNDIKFAVYDTGTGVQVAESVANSIVANKWIYVVGVADNGVAKVYIDGVQSGSIATYGSIKDIGTEEDLSLGTIWMGGGGQYFNGQIDEIRIYNRALTADEIWQMYVNSKYVSAHFGPNTTCVEDPGSCVDYGLVGYWDFEEGTGTTANDQSGNSNDGTLTYMATGTPWTTGITPFSGGRTGGTALSFDGTDDYVNADGVASGDETTWQGITTMAWVKHTSFSPSHQEIIRFGNNMMGGANLQTTGYECNLNYPAVIRAGRGGEVIPNLNQWYHVVCTYDKNNLILYVDGVEADRDATTTDIQGISTFRISRQPDLNRQVNGKIDEVRIYNRALSSEEIRYHYNRGGPVAHWKFNEGSGKTAFDATANDNDGTLYGEMATSTAQNSGWTTGKHGSALAFDGSDDYVKTAGNFSNSANAPITLSVWINSDVTSNDGAFYRRIIVPGGDQDFTLVLKAGQLTVYYNNGQELVDSNTISVGVWYHVVALYDGTRVRLYVNGDYVNSVVANLNSISSGPIRIGAYLDESNGWWDGLIDDVKIYNYALTPDQILKEYNAGKAMHFK